MLHLMMNELLIELGMLDIVKKTSQLLATSSFEISEIFLHSSGEDNRNIY